MQASKEVWGWIFGEEFLEKRLVLAQREWTRMKENDSLECRNCHEFQSMDFTRQSKRAADAHSTSLASSERTCIECHKGIAHRLPDMGKAAVSDEDLRQRRREEFRSWLVLAAIMAPVLAVLVVSGYGFIVWMLQATQFL